MAAVIIPGSVANAWHPDERLVRLVSQMSIPYTPGRTIQPGEPSQLPIGHGTRLVRDWIVPRFDFVDSGGLGRSPAKDPTPGRVRDKHEDGSAVDFMISTINGRPDPRGDELATLLVANAEAMNIEFLAWRDIAFGLAPGSRTARVLKVYTGPDSHENHIHVDFGPAGAAGVAPWFANPSLVLPDGYDPLGAGWWLLGGALTAGVVIAVAKSRRRR